MRPDLCRHRLFAAQRLQTPRKSHVLCPTRQVLAAYRRQSRLIKIGFGDARWVDHLQAGFFLERVLLPAPPPMGALHPTSKWPLRRGGKIEVGRFPSSRGRANSFIGEGLCKGAPTCALDCLLLVASPHSVRRITNVSSAHKLRAWVSTSLVSSCSRVFAPRRPSNHTPAGLMPSVARSLTHFNLYCFRPARRRQL